ncbi:hypothetical protein [Rhizobium sp. BR 315]|uniref:hypothetical protein n=1 Tax=Rhizobium sp. BR 315 TaxID=3040014 RepID=UPI003D35510F
MTEATQQTIPDDVLGVLGSWALIHRDGALEYAGRVVERLDADTFTVAMFDPATGIPGELAFLTKQDLTNPRRVVLFARREAWASTINSILAKAQQEAKPAEEV